MEPTTITSAATAAVGGISIATFAVGVTQIVKDLGVQGEVLKLVCILAGIAAWAVVTFFPEAWTNICVLLVALSSTGIVSFTKQELRKAKSRQ